MPRWSLQTSSCNVLPTEQPPNTGVFRQAFSKTRCCCKVHSHNCIKTMGRKSCLESLLWFGRSSELCNADYYRRQVIFSALSNSSHWGKKTGQHFISITKGMREDSIEREPFCQRGMASQFGTVSRGTRINISCLQLLLGGAGMCQSRSGKSDSASGINTRQTRNTAPLQTRSDLFAPTKWRGRGKRSDK